ncbi:GrxC Glutaredoxin and related proteins [uncultured Caudovirales phage]|uniref:GrxC Glutaredoxin and related proteins n=1 Tax=uncultured Caudovirales phage TaxID=2100421 RepID=A0A6J5N2J1_9CAUD|nr:GrxC Glutaredoxin and related proteins [uncultured Caudovirales phage]
MTYTIYGRSGCQPCQQAKALLESKGEEFKYMDVLDLPKEELGDFLSKGFKTVPQIFWEETHIGGLDALKQRINKEI